MSKKKPSERTARKPEKPEKADGQAAGLDLGYISVGLRPLAVPIDSLQFHPTNPRIHSEQHIADLAASIRKNLQTKNIIATGRTSPPTVLCGNGTMRAMLSLGHSHIACEVRHDLSEAHENQLVLIDNKIAADPEYDAVKLETLMRDVSTGEEELDRLLSELSREQKLSWEQEAAAGGQAAEDFEPLLDDENALDLLFKAPFPYFGGKSRVAAAVWKRFGEVGNYVEPFFGSGSMLLGRPKPWDGNETVNDADGFLANFWRAVQADPDGLAHHADWPVNENDLHARHAWLVAQKESMQAKLEGDPDWFDPKVAGWWVWGMACWIADGFCSGQGPWQVVTNEDGSRELVHLGDAGRGVNRKLVHLGDAGRGVNRKRVHLGDAGRGETESRDGLGENGLLAWMRALSERLRRVRVCCGDWTRVCGGDTGDATSHFFKGGGVCGVFLDPPYADTAGRNMSYCVDSTTVAHAVREWAASHGDNPKLRIALAGYEGEHKMPSSWKCLGWKAAGGMAIVGGDDTQGQANCHKERIWFSPHCLAVERAA